MSLQRVFAALFSMQDHRICTVVVILTGILTGVTSMTHTLVAFYTSSSQVPNFPEFVIVGILNGLPTYQYDSRTRRAMPKQEWMNRVTQVDPHFWEWNTQRDMADEQVERGHLEIVKQRFNQSEGLHIWQRMAGCGWDDVTGEVRGYFQFAFDGEDFISLDWDTQTWVAAKSQAFATKLKWQRIGLAVQVSTQMIYVCVENLKRLVRLGEEALKKRELPLVSFLQKSSSSPVTCHATGFYPDRAMLFWAKDGEELEEDPGEILPNNDGTFQCSVSLDLSSVPTEDWGRYSCVFQLSGATEDLITKLDPRLIRTNEKKHMPVIFVVLVSLASAAVAVVTGVLLYRRLKK